MKMRTTEETFLSLVSLGVGNARFVAPLPKDLDWHALEDLAAMQGLSAIIVDGLERLSENQRPPKEMLLQWIGETLQGFEYRYELYRRTIAEMAGWHNAHGFKMMVLKGYACSLDWPKPEHRPCGDIDIWQFGKQKEADTLLAKEKKIKIDTSHHHHTVFSWREFSVENHYDFVNVYSRQSNAEIERIFKELGADDSYSIDIYGEKVFLPSPNLHALFLLKHAMGNFVSTSINIRQVLDWAFFVKAHGNSIDWKWLIGVLKKFRMLEFFNIINAICVEDLGFEVSIFHGVQFKPELKERVLNDIFNPRFTVSEPANLIPRLFYKYKRWRGNAWKHELCYNESMWSTFWYGVWGHLLKPKSI